jgi:competence CoiA-like predicted nuclease
MVLVSRDYDGNHRHRVSMTECPVCGKTFGIPSGGALSSHFLHDHKPEDFGLSPLGER